MSDTTYQPGSPTADTRSTLAAAPAAVPAIHRIWPVAAKLKLYDRRNTFASQPGGFASVTFTNGALISIAYESAASRAAA